MTLWRSALTVGASLLLSIVAHAIPGPTNLTTHHLATEDAAAAGCGSIRLREARVFYKRGIACARAKKWAHRVYKTRGGWEPPGYECESGSGFKQGGGCFRDDTYFGWHPFD